MAKKAAAKKPAPKPAKTKKHERVAKPSEQQMMEKRTRLATGYLEQRDGLDPQLAIDIVEGMSIEEMEALIVEANTAVIDRTNGGAPEVSQDAEPDTEAVDYVTVEKLVADETFADDVFECARQAKAKNLHEKRYKELKSELFPKLREAGIALDQKVTVQGIGLTPYVGKSAPQLDATKLLEKGVSIDIINACYKSTTYNDVRVNVGKEVVLGE